MQVHTEGSGECGSYTYEVAETKVSLGARAGPRRGLPPAREPRGGLSHVQRVPRAHPGRGLARGAVAAPRPPDPRAPAVRARPRPRRRADPGRRRRRPGAAERGPRGLPRRGHGAASGRLAAAAAARPWPSAGCCRRPCCTCRARARPRPTWATCWRRCCSSPGPTPPRLLAAQGVTRLDVLNYISHGVSQGARRPRSRGPRPAARARKARSTPRRAARRLHAGPDRARPARGSSTR